jgi:hypothetical protein
LGGVEVFGVTLLEGVVLEFTLGAGLETLAGTAVFVGSVGLGGVEV